MDTFLAASKTQVLLSRETHLCPFHAQSLALSPGSRCLRTSCPQCWHLLPSLRPSDLGLPHPRQPPEAAAVQPTRPTAGPAQPAAEGAGWRTLLAAAHPRPARSVLRPRPRRRSRAWLSPDPGARGGPGPSRPPGRSPAPRREPRARPGSGGGPAVPPAASTPAAASPAGAGPAEPRPGEAPAGAGGPYLHGAAQEGARVSRQLLHIEIHDVHLGRGR